MSWYPLSNNEPLITPTHSYRISNSLNVFVVIELPHTRIQTNVGNMSISRCRRIDSVIAFFTALSCSMHAIVPLKYPGVGRRERKCRLQQLHVG